MVPWQEYAIRGTLTQNNSHDEQKQLNCTARTLNLKYESILPYYTMNLGSYRTVQAD